MLSAEVLPQNHRMLHVFHDSGFPVTTRTIPGVVLVELPTSLSPGAANAASRPRASALRRRHIGSLAELTNRKLRRSTHRSVAELEADLTPLDRRLERRPKPFVWTQDRRADPRQPHQPSSTN